MARPAGEGRPGVARLARHPLARGFYSTGVGLTVSAVGAFIRTPLTVSTLGAASFGVISTILSLCTWLQMSSAVARMAASSTAAPLEPSPRGLERATSLTAAATWRIFAPIAAVLALVTLLAPVDVAVDPAHHLTTIAVRGALIAGIVVAGLAIWGSARLGVLATVGSFAAQNISFIVSFVVTTAATVLAAVAGAPAWVFAVIWIVSLATPGLLVSPRALVRLRHLRRRRRAREGGVADAADARTFASSASWIVLGQQLGTGLDLLIITAVVGSLGSASYGLMWRLLQVLVAPLVGAAPLLTRAAQEARTSGEPMLRRRCRRLVIGCLGIEALCLVLFLALNGWLFDILGAGQIPVSAQLLTAGALWFVFEVARRIVLALTATTHDMRIWRRLSVLTAVPNVVASVLVTLWLGVSGPLFGSCLGIALLVGWALPSVRPGLRAALGR